MVRRVTLGEREIGPGRPCFFLAEIGINHNGSVETAKKLVAAAMLAGCEAVKFQKRTVDVVYSPDELSAARESPFGTTNGDLKRGLEFGAQEYASIRDHCSASDIMWLASCWDEEAVDFIDQFDPPAYKVASASLTDDRLLEHTRSKGKPVIISTGMSSLAEIDHAVEVLGRDDLIVLHCTSTYPSSIDELNLRCIDSLAKRFAVPIGYSGHEVGLATSIAAVVLGASLVERHITLDRAMWGSDQAASVEPHGFARLVRDARSCEKAMGDGVKCVYESEIPIARKLRRVGL